ncbi:MAG: hypothetical protein ACK4YQ_04215 [Phenylobacterium sp.]|uniref:hypothetical protein n=1 Tax=Phenylobacterium sp. TaxID=1871053 RepID=UPI00391B65EE
MADDATLQNTGAKFADAEVARCYLSRTPYPDALHASLHWMTHAVLFPKLADALAPDGIIAAVDGDGPADAPWLADHQAVVVRWLDAGQDGGPGRSL